MSLVWSNKGLIQEIGLEYSIKTIPNLVVILVQVYKKHTLYIVAEPTYFNVCGTTFAQNAYSIKLVYYVYCE